jgi:hypothetical protein
MSCASWWKLTSTCELAEGIEPKSDQSSESAANLQQIKKFSCHDQAEQLGKEESQEVLLLFY